MLQHMVTFTSSELMQFACSAPNFDNPDPVFIKVYPDTTEELGPEFLNPICLFILGTELGITSLVDSDHSHYLDTFQSLTGFLGYIASLANIQLVYEPDVQ
jgi:hypothetical protein